MNGRIAAFLFLLFVVFGVRAESDMRIMGLGVYECEYWHDRVFRQATNQRAMLKEATIYPYNTYQEWLNDKEGKEAFDEASNWISGYFASAQRYSGKMAKDKQQTTNYIVLRVFEICAANPRRSFEWAVSEAMPEFLAR